MAVQFNLLPDIKLEFDRQQRVKKLVFTLEFLTSAVVIVIFIISFFSVNILQKKLLNDANADINNYSQKLKAIPNFEKILTIQNQLNSLPTLHQQKHYMSRLLSYLPQVTPANVHIGKLSADTTASTISITGTADTVQSVNKFVDTLKNSNYVIDGVNSKADCDKQSGKWLSDTSQCTKLAFSNIILTKIDRDDKKAIYTINLQVKV